MKSNLQNAPSDGMGSSQVQTKIRQVVNHCIRQGVFAPADRQDLIQDLQLLMLEGRWSSICTSYHPLRTPFEQFLSKCLHRDCLKLRQQRRAYAPATTGYQEEWVLSCSGEVGCWALERLQGQLLNVLNYQKMRTPENRLLLKVHCGHLLRLSDLKTYAPKVHYRRLGYLHRFFSTPYLHRTGQENLGLLLPLFQEIESAALSLETLQRRVSRKLANLRNWLNANTAYHFDNEAVDNLLYLVLLAPEPCLSMRANL